MDDLEERVNAYQALALREALARSDDPGLYWSDELRRMDADLHAIGATYPSVQERVNAIRALDGTPKVDLEAAAEAIGPFKLRESPTFALRNAIADRNQDPAAPGAMEALKRLANASAKAAVRRATWDDHRELTEARIKANEALQAVHRDIDVLEAAFTERLAKLTSDASADFARWLQGIRADMQRLAKQVDWGTLPDTQNAATDASSVLKDPWPWTPERVAGLEAAQEGAERDALAEELEASITLNGGGLKRATRAELVGLKARLKAHKEAREIADRIKARIRASA